MTITRQSLAEHFGRLSDGELVAQFQSGELTELAREVAGAEIRSRNIEISTDEARPPETSKEQDADSVSAGNEDLVLLARFNDPSSAYLLQGRLEGEGIPSIIADALAYQNTFPVAIGGVRVLVPASQLVRAADIKARIDRGDFRLDDKVDGNGSGE